MQLSTLVSQVRHGILQNYGTLMQDNNDAIFHISNMLGYIYSYRVWKWALVEETVTSNNGIFTLSNDAIAIFKVNETTSQAEFKENSSPITDNNKSSLSNKYFHSGSTIRTSGTETSIDVLYMKYPKRLSSSDLEQEIDLPDGYINILFLLVMWMMYPYNLENGASLANNFKNMAEDVLKVYEKTHSLGIAPTSIQANELFNGR